MGSPAEHIGRIRSALLEGHILCGSRIGDGFQIPQCLLRIGDHGPCILRRRVPAQERKADGDDTNSLQHGFFLLWSLQGAIFDGARFHKAPLARCNHDIMARLQAGA
jgi:hypothetical protein